MELARMQCGWNGYYVNNSTVIIYLTPGAVEVEVDVGEGGQGFGGFM